MVDEGVRAKVLALVRKNPRQSAAEIARQAGVSRQRVHQILEPDYELTVKYEWRKKPK